MQLKKCNASQIMQGVTIPIKIPFVKHFLIQNFASKLVFWMQYDLFVVVETGFGCPIYLRQRLMYRSTTIEVYN